MKALHDAAPEVDSKTCVTRWSGENGACPMAMGVLLQRDGKLDSSVTHYHSC